MRLGERMIRRKDVDPSVFDVMGVAMCVVSLCSYDAASVNRT
jgi:hypothetical protein